MPISPVVISVAFGTDSAKATPGGPKGEIMLDMTGLLGSLRVTPLAIEGVAAFMLIGAERIEFLSMVIWTIDEDLWLWSKVGVNGVTGGVTVLHTYL